MVLIPDSTAQTGVGAWLWASGSQVCIGARPALAPNPTNTSRNENFSRFGGMVDDIAERAVQVSAVPPPLRVECPVQHQESEQRDRRSHDGQDRHLPGCFKRAGGALECDQQGCEQGNQLHPDPYQVRAGERGHDGQSKNQQVGVRVKPPQPLFEWLP